MLKDVQSLKIESFQVLKGFDREFLMTPVFNRTGTNHLKYRSKNACELISLFPV